MPSETPNNPPAYRAVLLRGLVLVIALATTAWVQRPDGRLHLLFPDLQGDAVLIQTPHGEFVLIDGGADPAALANTLGRRMPFWQRHLLAVILTTPDLSHLPGQLAAVQRYQVERALVTPAAQRAGSATLREWRRILAEQGTLVRAAHPGDTLDLGGATLRVLAVGTDPEAGMLLRIDYGSTSSVLAHASPPTSEAALMSTGLQPAQFVTFPWMREPQVPLLTNLRPQSILFTDGLHSDHPPLLTYTERSINGARLYHETIDGTVEWISDGTQSWVVTSD